MNCIIAQLLEIYWVKRAAKAYSVESFQSDREPLPKKRGLALIPSLSGTVSTNAIYKDSTIGIHRAHRLQGHGNNLIPTGQILILLIISWKLQFAAATPAVIEVEFRYELAIVSVTVTSHTAHLPVL